MKYYSGDGIKKNEIGGSCSMCGGKERCLQGSVEKPAENTQLGTSGHR